MSDDEKLYAADVAKRLCVSLRAAKRRLAAWERRYGASVVGRDWGGEQRARRYTTAEGMASVRPATKRMETTMLERVIVIEDEVRALRRDIQAICGKVSKNA